MITIDNIVKVKGLRDGGISDLWLNCYIVALVCRYLMIEQNTEGS